jgi:hypothetical protein
VLVEGLLWTCRRFGSLPHRALGLRRALERSLGDCRHSPAVVLQQLLEGPASRQGETTIAGMQEALEIANDAGSHTGQWVLEGRLKLRGECDQLYSEGAGIACYIDVVFDAERPELRRLASFALPNAFVYVGVEISDGNLTIAVAIGFS